MFCKLKAFLQKPELYRANIHPFWDDEHISAQMLKAHLDPEGEAASRSHAFMDRSAEWIAQIAPPQAFVRLLDLGCGPGLYAQRFAQRGYQVTGVDLSARSLQYAREHAQGMKIRYLQGDYRRMALGETFDLVTLIYCDYGVMSPEDRLRVLANARHHLRPGGRMVMDVFSTAYEAKFTPYQRWQDCPEGGFWRAQPHIVLEEGARYPGHVLGRKYAVLMENELISYYLWDTCFTPDSLAAEAQAAGFCVAGIVGNAAGEAWTAAGDTPAAVLERAE